MPADLGRILHLHIPKTGGTSLRQTLREAVEIARGRPPVLFEAFGVDCIGELSKRRKEVQRAELICGHFGWASAQQVGARYVVTQIRDPIARTASHLRYALQGNHWLRPLLPPSMQYLRDALRVLQVRRLLTNFQVRLLTVLYLPDSEQTNIEQILSERPMAVRDLVDPAVEILSADEVIVGTTEDWYGLRVKLERKIGLSLPGELPHLNTTWSSGEPLDPDDRDAFAEITRQDALLYDWLREQS